MLTILCKQYGKLIFSFFSVLMKDGYIPASYSCYYWYFLSPPLNAPPPAADCAWLLTSLLVTVAMGTQEGRYELVTFNLLLGRSNLV